MPPWINFKHFLDAVVFLIAVLILLHLLTATEGVAVGLMVLAIADAI